MTGFMVDPVVLNQIGEEFKSIADRITQDVGRIRPKLSLPAGSGNSLATAGVLTGTANGWAEDLLSLARIVRQAGEDLQANAAAYQASDSVEKFDSILQMSRP